MFVCACVGNGASLCVCELLCQRFFCCVGVDQCVRVSVCLFLSFFVPAQSSPPFLFLSLSLVCGALGSGLVLNGA